MVKNTSEVLHLTLAYSAVSSVVAAVTEWRDLRGAQVCIAEGHVYVMKSCIAVRQDVRLQVSVSTVSSTTTHLCFAVHMHVQHFLHVQGVFCCRVTTPSNASLLQLMPLVCTPLLTTS